MKPRAIPVAILVDVMDTLVHEPFFVEMPAFFGMTLEELLAAKHPTAWVEFEHGRMTEEEFLVGFFADGRAYDQAGFLACIANAYRWVDGMEELAKDLSAAGVALHALSNYPLWYRRIEERLSLSRFLRWSFVSCDTGVRKPDPEAFLGAARALDRAPGELLLIDDQEPNCHAAEAVGMPAVHFRGASELRDELGARSIL